MQKAVELSNLAIYRKLLKAAKLYPSVKQRHIYRDIRLLFQEHRNLTDPKTIKEEQKRATMGLAHMDMLIEKSKELQESSNTSPTNHPSLNPPDDNFIYF